MHCENGSIKEAKEVTFWSVPLARVKIKNKKSHKIENA